MKAVVVGAGPGACTAAMVLTDAGWDVVLLDKGVNHFADLTAAVPHTDYGNDELKMRRGFGRVDPDLEPRTFRSTQDQAEPTVVGDVNTVPVGPGGGTTQWDAKTPRFWDIDFAKASLLGPVDGASIIDWPVTYADLEPYYEVAETLLGVAGDVDAVHATPAGRYARHRAPLPQPPGVAMLSSTTLAEGAAATGLVPIPFPEAINSTYYDDRPSCISCGHCSGFGCPIHDRGSGLLPLRRALLTGRAELRDQAMVTAIVHDGTRASAVRWLDAGGAEHTEGADLVILGAGPVESVRLALLSQLPDPHGLVGRGLMYHWFAIGFGIWSDRRLHAMRGRDVTHAVYDFCDPEFPGARAFATEHGLPYLRGGVLEMGGAPKVLDEAMQYVGLLEQFDPGKPFGARFKELMRQSPLRDRLAGVQMIAEDLPQLANRVDLDPKVRDRFGLPVPRITYLPHRHELVAQDFYNPKIADLIRAAGATTAGVLPQSSTPDRPSPEGNDAPVGYHTMGGLRMGPDPSIGVTDEVGRWYGLENVAVADGAVFPTSGAHNPTLTIVATAWRNARAWAGRDGPPTPIAAVAPAAAAGAPPAAEGVSTPVVVAGIAAAGAAAAVGATALARRRRPGPGADDPAGTGTAIDRGSDLSDDASRDGV